MKRESHTSVHILPAGRSDLAAVIRRGPSKWWHFLLWDRATGIVKPGSWFHGMVYPHRCDLSPKGEWFLLVAYKGTNDPVAWTALCRPPAVRAEVFWGQDTAALGGGLFDPRLPIVWLNLRQDRNPPDIRARTPFEFGYIDEEHRGYGGLAERLLRDGWERREMPAAETLAAAAGQPCDSPEEQPPPMWTTWRMPLRKSPHTLVLEYPGVSEVESRPAPPSEDPAGIRYFLQSGGSGALPLGGVCWAGWNSRGQLCLARDCCLYTADPATRPLRERPVLDLRGLAPPRERLLREAK